MHPAHGSEPFLVLDQAASIRHLPHSVSHLLLVGVLLLVWILFVRLEWRRYSGMSYPSARLSLGNVLDALTEWVYGITESIIGKKETPHFFPFVASLFYIVFFSNVLGLIPGFVPPTEDINTTLALGVFVFVFYHVAGLRAHGWAYFKHFLGPVLAIAPLMLVIEIVSHLSRPLSMALRLRGNIVGDHIVLEIFTDLVPFVVPVIFYFMGIFVAFLQAFVFALLTMVYISLSVAHDHD
jgi:F-type H+-transporting ATPase subunit a